MSHDNPEDYNYDEILQTTIKWTEDAYKRWPNFPGRVIFEDHFLRYQTLRQLIFNYYVKNDGGTILDIGWGGFPIAYDMCFNGEYHGLDFNDQAVSMLLKYPMVRHIQGNFEDGTLYPNDFYDLIIWSEGPEHAIHVDSVMIHIKHALKPRGHFITSTPNNWGMSELHVRNFTEESFKQLLQRHFKVVEYKLIQPWLTAVCV